MVFQDRQEAAKLLARQLIRVCVGPPLVLGVPRGGVPMARTIADALNGDLDVVLVHKLRAFSQPEFALGAVDEQGQVTRNVDSGEVDPEYFEQETQEQLELLRRRRRLYTPHRAALPVAGRCVIVVDDGIATGATLVAALRTIRANAPGKLIVAIPVASAAALVRVRAECDEVVCLQTPSQFFSVGQYFQDFSSVSDDEVVKALSSDSR